MRRKGISLYPADELTPSGHRDAAFVSKDVALRFAPGPWLPPTDVFLTEEAMLIHMELAGVRVEDVQVQVRGDAMVVRGVRRRLPESPGATYHLAEIRAGEFERVFELPAGAASDRITARMREGMLIVKVPRHPATGAERITLEDEEEE